MLYVQYGPYSKIKLPLTSNIHHPPSSTLCPCYCRCGESILIKKWPSLKIFHAKRGNYNINDYLCSRYAGSALLLAMEVYL